MGGQKEEMITGHCRGYHPHTHIGADLQRQLLADILQGAALDVTSILTTGGSPIIQIY